MKLLFTDTHNGYNFSTYSKYYLCETEEEYNEQMMYCCRWNERAYGDCWIGINTQITCTPHTSVSDGYAVSGGHDFKATGCYTAHSQSGLSTSRTEYNYYIKPDSIVTDEVEKAKGWWV